MNKPISFASNAKFFAQNYFPYGLSRCGEFSCEQVELLESHGQAYQAIHSGSRTPLNQEERGFLAVCRGERTATTVHEKAWSRFCDKTSGHPSIITTPTKGSSQSSIKTANAPLQQSKQRSAPER